MLNKTTTYDPFEEIFPDLDIPDAETFPDLDIPDAEENVFPVYPLEDAEEAFPAIDIPDYEEADFSDLPGLLIPDLMESLPRYCLGTN